MELTLDLEHEIADLRLCSPDDRPKTAETVRVEHSLGELKGELILKFDDQGRLFSVSFMHPSRQLLPSQIDSTAPRR